MKNEDPLNAIASLFWFVLVICLCVWALKANWSALGNPQPAAKPYDPCAQLAVEQSASGVEVCYQPGKRLDQFKSHWQPASQPGERK